MGERRVWKLAYTCGSILAEVDRMQGRVLGERYRLDCKLGQGGMGSVWLAEHLTLRTQVAIKLIDPLSPTLRQSDEALARFHREALAAAQLRSTHIVQIIDYGVDDGLPYIALELLHGENLAQRLARRERLSLGETAQILAQVGRGLALAHSRGIVHRDLKPENVFICQEGNEELVKVLDFGVAKMCDCPSVAGGAQLVRTTAGAIIGTPYYMSPEQARGEAGVDQRSDIWSLGIIAYECVMGRRPFEQDALGTLLVAICQDVPPKPSDKGDAPPEFDEWFARVCARDKAARFRTVTEAASSLTTLAGIVAQRQSGRWDPLSSASPSGITSGGVVASEGTPSGGAVSATPTILTTPKAPTSGPARPRLAATESMRSSSAISLEAPRRRPANWLVRLAPVAFLLAAAVGYTGWRLIEVPFSPTPSARASLHPASGAQLAALSLAMPSSARTIPVTSAAPRIPAIPSTSKHAPSPSALTIPAPSAHHDTGAADSAPVAAKIAPRIRNPLATFPHLSSSSAPAPAPSARPAGLPPVPTTEHQNYAGF